MKKHDVKNNIIHIGLDYLELYTSCKYEAELFDSLDFDNSNIGEIEDYVYTKTEVQKYTYKILFSYQGYSVFAYYKGDKSQNVPTKDYFVVYGTGFKLLSEDEIRYFIEGYFYNISHLRRIDICIDIPFFIMDVLKKFSPYRGKGAEFHDSNGDIATKYYGEKVWSKNKRHIIRVYNKVLDIVHSKKIKLFRDYLQFDALTRIELEIRSELAKNVSYGEVWKKDIQQALLKNYLSKRTKLFDFFPQEKLSLFLKKDIQIDSEDYQGLYYKTQRKNIFLGHARGIYNLGFCPVRVLIDEGLIQPKTEMILDGNLIDQLRIMEKKIKQRFFLKKQKERDFQNLLGSSPEYEDRGE